MSILWTAPVALAGLLLIVLPIAVHLFARQQLRTLRYPSLRFLQQTQLASFRRRSIADGVLLASRIAIVAAAAAALAGPLVETASRAAGHAGRISRAIVVSGEVSEATLTALEHDTFRAIRLERAQLADALVDAVRWLDAQPRSTREIVVAGALRRGSLESVDLDLVPVAIGIRFEQTTQDGPLDSQLSILTRRDGRLVRIDRAVRFTDDLTRVAEGAAVPVAPNLVTIAASSDDTTLADAALRAALDAGVPWQNFDRRVALVWSGGNEASGAGAEVVRMSKPDPPSSAADAVLAALTKFAPERTEPLTITKLQLDSWSRRPGPPAVDAPTGDESDRRWLWAVVLALLAVEAWLRRGRTGRPTAIGTGEEARVA